MMKNKMKRLTAALLMGVMLFGGVLTAHAATLPTASPTSSSHAHKKDREEVSTVSTPRVPHQYQDRQGNIKNDCYVRTVFKTTRIICSCGEVIETINTSVDEHSIAH